jgi:hypothetical protein
MRHRIVLVSQRLILHPISKNRAVNFNRHKSRFHEKKRQKPGRNFEKREGKRGLLKPV